MGWVVWGGWYGLGGMGWGMGWYGVGSVGWGMGWYGCGSTGSPCPPKHGDEVVLIGYTYYGCTYYGYTYHGLTCPNMEMR